MTRTPDSDDERYRALVRDAAPVTTHGDPIDVTGLATYVWPCCGRAEDATGREAVTYAEHGPVCWRRQID